MPRYLLGASLLFCCFGALAQPMGQGGLAAEQQMEREQRRAELRSVLKPARSGEAVAQAAVAGVAGKHLSQREHAEMREQLRQQVENRRPGQ